MKFFVIAVEIRGRLKKMEIEKKQKNCFFFLF